MDYKTEAINKLKRETNTFKGGQKEKAMQRETFAVLESFCRQSEEFSQAVVQSDKTFSDCMAAVAKGTGSSISDIEAYKKAVRFYFAGADIKCVMTIDLIGDAKSDNAPIVMTSVEPTSKPAKKKSVLELLLDDLF